mmetsp:Transcript_16789/g.48235  ORF Transcript_16789/g.48235 Transcript_16789/m.48235 type:complete len:304 (+) Transcript_16789:2228-3139(+)
MAMAGHQLGEVVHPPGLGRVGRGWIHRYRHRRAGGRVVDAAVGGVLAVRAAAVRAAPNPGVVALAVLLEAGRLAALAPDLVALGVLLAGCAGLANLVLERRRVALQDEADGLGPFLLLAGIVVAHHAPAGRAAHGLGGEALAVQLETLGLLARAADGLVGHLDGDGRLLRNPRGGTRPPGLGLFERRGVGQILVVIPIAIAVAITHRTLQSLLLNHGIGLLQVLDEGRIAVHRLGVDDGVVRFLEGVGFAGSCGRGVAALLFRRGIVTGGGGRRRSLLQRCRVALAPPSGRPSRGGHRRSLLL